MNDPSRLRDDAGTPDFERELLRSAKLDREPEDGAARALAALGMAVGTAAGVATSGAAPTTPAIAGAGGGTGFTLVAKLVVVAAFVGGTTIGAVTLVNRSAASEPLPPAPPVPAMIAAAPVPTVPSPATSAEATEPSPSAAAEPPRVRAPSPAIHLPSARAAPAPPSAAPVSPLPATSSLSEELTLVDRARAATKRGDLAAAGSALDEHDARFRNGPLVAEATVARIELLVLSGDADSARALGERFLGEHPGTTHERRVRDLVRRAQSKTNPR